MNVNALSKEDRLKLRIRKRESDKTYNEVMKLIRTNNIGKCMVVRPTGFGKSYMLARVTSESTIINNGGTALYVYPYDTIKSDIEKKYGENGTSNVKLKSTNFMTYKMFTSLGKAKNGRPLIKYLNDNNVRIILLDEVHLAGADGFQQAYANIKHKIGSGQGKIRLIGVTATPYRMDGFDILKEIFDGHKVYDYTMDDCIKDGLMRKPLYKSSLQSADIVSDLIVEYSKKYLGINREILRRKAKWLVETQDKIEINDMINPSYCIRNSIARVLNNDKPDYLKFIVFFPTIKSMSVMEGQVSDYFSGAFPYLKQNILRISSASDSDDVEELHKLKYREGIIDIIFCVNKINMGYHVDDINGIMMLRGTRSDIIYKQQIGRCMSITSKITPVVFDMINNVSKKPYYQVSLNDFEDVETDELDAQLSGDIIQRDSELNRDSLEIDENAHEYSEILSELCEQLNKDIEKEICWLYTYRQTPLYILTNRYCGSNTLKKDIIGILEKNGITIEDETYMRDYVDASISRKLHSLSDRRGRKANAK